MEIILLGLLQGAHTQIEDRWLAMLILMVVMVEKRLPYRSTCSAVLRSASGSALYLSYTGQVRHSMFSTNLPVAYRSTPTLSVLVVVQEKVSPHVLVFNSAPKLLID